MTLAGDAGGDGRLTPSFRPRQVEKKPPCQEGCATSGDIRAWIGVIAQHEKTGISRGEAFDRAWGIIADVNPFPASLGRVCPHPCESGCNRTGLDVPVSVNALEQFLGDWGIRQNLRLPGPTDGPNPEWIGVVGAGPSGLSFAWQMIRRGYRVTVYESREKAGGMLRYGIPDYRLPPDVLDAEIQRIQEAGVDIRLGVAVGRDVTMEELRARHPALYVGIGAQRGRRLGIPGEEGPGVVSGTDYLARVSRGEPMELGGRVVVIGGGNTAIDAARTARRTGAEVMLLYRRSREEMPAFDDEVEEALEEGVGIAFLAAPVRLERARGQLQTLVAQRMCLGEPDESGRRRPVPVEGSDFELSVDTVIAAVSQEAAWDGLDGLPTEWGWVVTDATGAVDEGIWAGGDARGLGIAGEAIAHGRRAAEAVHRELRGLPEPAPDVRPPVGPDELVMDYHPPRPAVVRETLPVAERVADPTAEVRSGLTEAEAIAEASRCFSCGLCFGCQQCWMFCTPGCFTRVEEAETGVYFTLALDQCEECGKCIDVCPCGFLEMT